MDPMHPLEMLNCAHCFPNKDPLISCIIKHSHKTHQNIANQIPLRTGSIPPPTPSTLFFLPPIVQKFHCPCIPCIVFPKSTALWDVTSISACFYIIFPRLYSHFSSPQGTYGLRVSTVWGIRRSNFKRKVSRDIISILCELSATFMYIESTVNLVWHRLLYHIQVQLQRECHIVANTFPMRKSLLHILSGMPVQWNDQTGQQSYSGISPLYSWYFIMNSFYEELSCGTFDVLFIRYWFSYLKPDTYFWYVCWKTSLEKLDL